MSEGAVPINVVVTGSGRRLRVTLKSAGAQGVLHALRNCDKAALTNTTLFVDDETMEQVDSIDRLERMRTYRAFMGALVRVTLFVTGRAGGVGGDGRCRLAITHEFTLDQLLRSIRTRLYIGMEYTLDLFRSEGRVPVRNVSEIGPGQEVEVHLRKRAALPLLLEGLQFAHQAAPTNAAMAMAGGPALRAVPATQDWLTAADVVELRGTTDGTLAGMLQLVWVALVQQEQLAGGTVVADTLLLRLCRSLPHSVLEAAGVVADAVQAAVPALSGPVPSLGLISAPVGARLLLALAIQFAADSARTVLPHDRTRVEQRAQLLWSQFQENADRMRSALLLALGLVMAHVEAALMLDRSPNELLGVLELVAHGAGLCFGLAPEPAAAERFPVASPPGSELLLGPGAAPVARFVLLAAAPPAVGTRMLPLLLPRRASDAAPAAGAPVAAAAAGAGAAGADPGAAAPRAALVVRPTVGAHVLEEAKQRRAELERMVQDARAQVEAAQRQVQQARREAVVQVLQVLQKEAEQATAERDRAEEEAHHSLQELTRRCTSSVLGHVHARG